MNKGVNPSNASPQDQAAVWNARLSSEASSESDWLAFETWLQNPVNRVAYEALEQQLEAIATNPDAFETFAERGPVRAPRMPLATVRWGAMAAVAATLLVAFVFLAQDRPQLFAYDAPAAASRTVTLPDASIVDLNRGASVRVEWRRGMRRLVLDRGEAAFRVVHDDAKVFEVVAGDVTLRDVGTEFNVVRDGDALMVSVRDGAVDVRESGRSLGVVRAGFQARVNAEGAAITRADDADAFAWRTGQLVYHDTPLERVLSDFNRYGGAPIVVGDARAGELRFSGVIVIDDSQRMLRRLEAFLPIQSEQDADRIVVRSRR